MQKYTNGTEIRHFEDDVNVSDWIDLSKYRLMTNEEILKHETPKPTKFHTEWNGTEWIDIRTEEEKLAYNRSIMPSLSRRQFKLALLENGLLKTVEQMIESIEDPTIKARIQIEYSESERFERSNESVQYMLGVLNLTSDQVDEMWHFAMTL